MEGFQVGGTETTTGQRPVYVWNQEISCMIPLKTTPMLWKRLLCLVNIGQLDYVEVMISIP